METKFVACPEILFVLTIIFRCHLGNIIKYDTVGKMKWTIDLRTHSIRTVVEQILIADWEPPSEDSPGRQVPELGNEDDCIVSSLSFLKSIGRLIASIATQDCFNWEFGDFPDRQRKGHR